MCVVYVVLLDFFISRDTLILSIQDCKGFENLNSQLIILHVSIFVISECVFYFKEEFHRNLR